MVNWNDYPLWREVTENQWNDWHWQMGQKAVCSDPSSLLELDLIQKDEVEALKGQISLTPYNIILMLDLRKSDLAAFRAEYLQSIPIPRPTSKKRRRHQWVWAKRRDLKSSVFARCLPKVRTLFFGRGSDTETEGLENFYPKTDAIVVSAVCARHCAHCFREVGDPQGEATQMTGRMASILKAVDEIVKRKTPHILITGGDPLTRNTAQLKRIMTPLVESNTVEVIRLGTRMPVDLPMRFCDDELLQLLKDFAVTMRQRGASLRIVTQVNHPCELTAEARQAIRNIQNCGIEILNQTAIFKGINDNIETLRTLFMELDRLGIKPYKLYHPMPVQGKEYLRIPIRKFRKLLAGLHQWLPGTAVPQANVVSLIGKMPVSPSGRYMIPIPFTNLVLIRNWRREWYLFKDAQDYVRRAFEIVGATVMALFVVAVVMLWRPTNQQLIDPSSIKKVSRVVDEFDYPDAWARTKHQPFIENGTLYVPLGF